MKKLMVTLLTVTALAAMAAPSFAYVSSSLLSTDPSGTSISDQRQGGSGGADVGVGASDPASTDGDRGDDPPPTRPVPEPGTLALASMGLLALGVAGRKRQTS